MSEHSAAVRPPDNWRSLSWQAPDDLARLGGRGLVIGAVGFVLLLIGYFVNPQRLFESYLVAYFFWLALALGGLAISMLHHLTRGAWGLVARRILEACSRTLPFMALLFLPLLFAMSQGFYPWARPDEVAASELLQHKAPYLNAGFFTLRAAIYFAIWCFLAWKLSRLSRQQDEGDESVTQRMANYSAPGIIIWVLTITFAAFDWLMSLDPEWFSTIYGVWFLGGMGLATFAFLIIIGTYLGKREPMVHVFAPRHFHDYGKLMFAFTLLWAYFSFSQFLIIWSANLPEEITFYLARTRHGWQYFSLFLVLGHFILPFLLLLSRTIKRNPAKLVRIALLILCMRWVDFYWQVGPTLHPESLLPHWLDIAAMAAVGGIWFWRFTRELSSRPLLPLNAPNLEEALGE